jgi:hypothetical protein
MKRLFLLAFLIIMVLILINRQRVFVRDPLASVYTSTAPDGSGAVKQGGVQVYINYSNDVLLVKDSQLGGYTLLVQHWNKTPGTPVQLKCIHWMACLTDNDRAAVLPVQPNGTNDPHVEMNDRELSFVDAQGARTRVQLR